MPETPLEIAAGSSLIAIGVTETIRSGKLFFWTVHDRRPASTAQKILLAIFALSVAAQISLAAT